MCINMTDKPADHLWQNDLVICSFKKREEKKKKKKKKTAYER